MKFILQDQDWNKAGIYKISNTVNENIYIGSAFRLRQRYLEHLSRLSKKYHHSVYLQNHSNKYGIETLSFELIELCDKEILLDREQYFISSLSPRFNGTLNVRRPNLGKKASPELRKILSIAANNRPPVTQEFRDKMSKITKGRIVTDTRKSKIIAAQKGRPLKQGHCIKLSQAAKNRKFQCNVYIVLDISTGVFYYSIKEVADLYNLSRYQAASRIKNMHPEFSNLRIV